MKVINELTRMSNVTPGIFRKTLTDVQVNGILIQLYEKIVEIFHYCLGRVFRSIYDTKK